MLGLGKKNQSIGPTKSNPKKTCRHEKSIGAALMITNIKGIHGSK